MPVVKIYRHVNDLSRAQLVADTAVDALRAECSNSSVGEEGDAWISQSTDSEGLPSGSGTSGNVLVFRKSNDYFETIAADYSLADLWQYVSDADEAKANGEVNSRAIYLMFDDSGNAITNDTGSGYIHFGYFNATDGSSPANWSYYDYTNPFLSATYRDFKVALYFHDLNVSAANSYVLCDVTVKDANGVSVYTRTVALRLS